MEAHGIAAGQAAPRPPLGLLPDAVAAKLMEKAGVDRLGRPAPRRSTWSAAAARSRISGVYGGAADPLPMLTLFDKQVQLRMGQANVKRWIRDILPLLTDDDPLGVDDFATHHLPLDEAPEAYEMFQEKEDGAVKVVFRP